MLESFSHIHLFTDVMKTQVFHKMKGGLTLKVTFMLWRSFRIFFFFYSFPRERKRERKKLHSFTPTPL